MASRFGLPAALSMPEILLSEDDDMSDDEFDSYIDPDEAPNNGDVGDDYEESESDNDVPPIPDFQQPTGPSVDLSSKTPLDYFKQVVTDEMHR